MSQKGDRGRRSRPESKLRQRIFYAVGRVQRRLPVVIRRLKPYFAADAFPPVY
jgi:hypothetical protein